MNLWDVRTPRHPQWLRHCFRSSKISIFVRDGSTFCKMLYGIATNYKPSIDLESGAPTVCGSKARGSIGTKSSGSIYCPIFFRN